MMILIVEDDVGISQLLTKKLEKLGYETETISSAKEALVYLDGPLPDMMVLDYDLPGMNAKELVETLKKRERHLPPFIVVTGHGDERIAVEMMKLGARDYMIKDKQFLDFFPEILNKVGKEIEKEKKLKQAEKSLRISEMKFRTLVEQAGDGFELLDKNGRFIDMNSATTIFLGYTREELLKLSIPDIDPLVSAEKFHAVCTAMVPHVPITFESVHRRKDGTEFPVEITSSKIQMGEETNLLSLVRDITQRKESEKRIQKLLLEKETLLREVHHRIKNNMNTLVSMLRIQMGGINHPEALKALKSAENRIRSMIVLYDKLYRSNSLEKVSLKNYLADLVEEILCGFPNRSIVDVEKNLEDFDLEIKKLSSLGILLNELLTNAMKHAFTGLNKGKISISASKKENHCEIVLWDNGVGLPPHINIETSPGMGLKLVRLLSEQIDGTIRLEKKEGTKYILEFMDKQT